MGELLRESLGEGAWGYSTGLEYAQESGATEEEITALCRSLDGQLYATHTRRRDEGQFESVEEAIRTAERAEARLQVSHLVPRNGIEESRRSIELVERARDRGLDVEFDMHTRRFGITHLYAALPPWALGADDLGALLQRRRARATRMRPHRSILSAGNDWSRIVAASTTRSGPSTPAATSPRSRPSAARRRSTPSTTCSCRRSRSRTS